MPATKSQRVFAVGDTVIMGTGNPADGYPNDIYVLHDGDIYPPSVPQADGYSVDEDPGDCNDA